MKSKIVIGLISIMGICLFVSCEKFLEEKTPGIETTNGYYTTVANIQTAANACYTVLRSGQAYRNDLGKILETRHNDIVVGPNAALRSELLTLYTYSLSSTTGSYEGTWSVYYSGISHCNAAIDFVKNEPIGVDKTTAPRVIAQAYCLRALYYFDLVRIYGEVPLRLKFTSDASSLDMPKSTIDQIYSSIISDLKYACGETSENPGLPVVYENGGDNNGRATLGFAQALLAKVYLFRKDWNNAAKYTDMVIKSGKYALWPNFKDYFYIKNKNQPNSAPLGEAVFEAQLNNDLGDGNYYTTWCLPVRSAIPPTSLGWDGAWGQGDWVAKADLYRSYEKGDERRMYTFLSDTFPDNNANGGKGGYSKVDLDTATYRYIYKYRLDDQTTPWGNNMSNIPIIRYSDVLLMYAEALNEGGTQGTLTQYAAINLVRSRAKISPLIGLTKDAFREAVYKERRLEFVFEFQRFYDLQRTGRLIAAIQDRVPGFKDGMEYIPIPQSELDVNKKMVQNPAW
ncbi:MAG TPA: RagB/SusD family nutrient uptake outer membrane protein [Prolixibacteraceae bacterium]|nr:RagB/SusD family nutrient uptake outer membrane protein [Prolixibacteraceae bacterium]